MFKDFNIRIGIKNIKTVSQIFLKVKAPVPLFEKSNIVYNILCFNCNKVYIEQTSRTLKDGIHYIRMNVEIIKNRVGCLNIQLKRDIK